MTPTIPAPARPVAETPADATVPLWVQPEWAEQFPWLVQGTTGTWPGEEPFDLGVWGRQPVGVVLGRWRALQQALGMPGAVHARQVHGGSVARQRTGAGPGLLLTYGVDGHHTADSGLLLSVSVADCVPVFLVDPERRAVALLHAGWRGVAAGILEHGVAALETTYGSDRDTLRLHCGPSVCGCCYEVGPEVHHALRPATPPPDVPAPVDLRALLVERAVRDGLRAEHCSVSTHCTRCAVDRPGVPAQLRSFFSHRAGDVARQMGLLGIRPDA